MSKNKIRYGSICSGVEAASLAWKELGWECVFVSEIEPFPCAVLNRRFGASRPINDCPNKAWNKKNKELPEYDGTGIPNEGDFTKIGKKYENKYDLLIGGTPCFPAGTFVLTKEGYKPIEDISVGEFVLTDKLRLKRVVRTGSKIADNLVEVKIEGRPPFFVTSNHPFQIADRSGGEVAKQEIGLSEGKYATMLKSDRLSSTDVYNGELKEISGLTGLSEKDCCELIGWYFSCGNGDLLLSGNEYYSGLSYVGKFESCFGGKFEYKVLHGNDREDYIIEFNDNVKNWFLYNFGTSIHIPLWVYGLSNELKDHIKSGFLSSRSCSNEDSFSLFYGQSLFGLLDLFGNKEFYGVSITNNDKTLLNFQVVKPHKFAENSERYFAKIEYVKKVEKKETVYNIEVEDDHTYIANGVRVWNCQDASVAGKRAGLVEGSRSRLAFDFVRLAYESRVRWLVWENVPGVFSVNDGKDFAEFLSSFAGWDVTIPDGGWQSAGIVTNATEGNFGLAWRVLDGQYVRTQSFPFAVPQRRRRVFVIGYFGDWRRAAEVLFERKGLYGDIVPCRKARKEIAEDVRECLERTMRVCDISEGKKEECSRTEDGKCAGTELIGSDNSVLNALCFASAGFSQKIESDVASTLSTDHDNRVTGINAALIMENQVYSFDSLASNSMKSSNPNSGCHKAEVSKTIDTTIPEPSKNQGGMVVVAIDGDKINKKERKGGSGLGINEDGASYTLTAKDVHAVAIEKQECYNVAFCDANGTRKDRPNGGCYITKADASKTITTEGQNETVVIDVFTKSSKPRNPEEAPTYKEAMVANTLNCFENNNDGRAVELICEKNNESDFVSDSEKEETNHHCSKHFTVRRLLPIEAERLMGFPDNHTRIDWNGKSDEECSDGPRYKACGNSMCVNVMQWIGEQIQRVEDEINEVK